MTKHCHLKKRQSYYLNIDEFISNFITIPTTNYVEDSPNTSSYIAGRATLYKTKNDDKFGICSASFLCINTDNVFVDIANYITLDNGLIISWLTPSTCANLEIDSIINSMVTECIVTASTKIGFNPYYGKKFNLKVKSKNGKICFDFKMIE